MKKSLIAVTVLLYVFVMFGCKGSENEYVNLWPGFSIKYPKDWKEMPAMQGFLRIQPPKAGFMSGLTMQAMPNVKKEDLKNYSTVIKKQLSFFGEDINILSDKEVKTNDGTKAQEVELEFWVKSGPKLFSYYLVVPKDDVWVVANAVDDKKISEDYKKVAYTVRLSKEEAKPVKVEEDIEQFLDQYGRALMSKNEEKIFSFFSENYQNDGMKKNDIKNFAKMTLANLPAMNSYKYIVIKLEEKDDVIFIQGYTESDTLGKMSMKEYIKKENNEWKLYGNQKGRQMPPM